MINARLFLTLHKVDVHCAKLGRTNMVHRCYRYLLHPPGYILSAGLPPLVEYFLIHTYSSYRKRENSAV